MDHGQATVLLIELAPVSVAAIIWILLALLGHRTAP